MTHDEMRDAVLQALASVAPEIRPAEVDPAASLRDQLDIDSMDFINFVAELDKTLGVAVPEADYGELATVDGCVAYLERALAARQPS